MEIIGIICEYNPFHNGHLYHIEQIKKLYPDSIIILVLNGYFLERGEISILTKEDKVKLALDNQINLVVELPVLFGTQSADIFANKAMEILNYLKGSKLVFGSESNDIERLTEIAQKQMDDSYQKKVKVLLKEGINYPTALARSLNINFDFNNPNDLLAISYIKAILKNNYPITPISIKRTNSYHDLNSNDKIISASNIRHKLTKKEDITNYVPSNSLKAIQHINYELLYKLIKSKILTTPHLEQFLTVDEGIENRLYKAASICQNLEEFILYVKTKRYTYNKIQRMIIHILLGITKNDNDKTIDYLHILGFDSLGKNYLNSIKKDMEIPISINKKSALYKFEIQASLVYDLIQNTNTIDFEKNNQPIIK